LIVWREDDGFTGAEAFEDESVVLAGCFAEFNAALLSARIGGDDPDLGVVNEGGFGDVEGESTGGG
jgi:hypothetical protein